MKYPALMLAVAGEVWALERSKLEAITQFLLFKADGGMFGEDEIQARAAGARQGQRGGAPPDSSGGIGVLPIYGVMAQRMNLITHASGGTSMEQVAADFRTMLADPAIKAIILDIDSPGGTVSGTTELATEIYNSRGVKPIIAQVNSTAASGAYWIASQADEIAVTPSGQAGSIGVYTIHEDMSKALEKQGVKETIIKAGKYKMIAPESQPLSEEAHGIIQARVNEAQAMFTRAVARGRNVSVSKVNDTFGQGLMFGAQELVNRGMADRVSSLAATCARFGADPHPVVTANTSAGRHFADMRASLDDMHKVLRTTR
jgi:signal peptide peptidase SppA